VVLALEFPPDPKHFLDGTSFGQLHATLAAGTIVGRIAPVWSVATAVLGNTETDWDSGLHCLAISYCLALVLLGWWAGFGTFPVDAKCDGATTRYAK